MGQITGWDISYWLESLVTWQLLVLVSSNEHDKIDLTLLWSDRKRRRKEMSVTRKSHRLKNRITVRCVIIIRETLSLIFLHQDDAGKAETIIFHGCNECEGIELRHEECSFHGTFFALCTSILTRPWGKWLRKWCNTSMTQIRYYCGGI